MIGGILLALAILLNAAVACAATLGTVLSAWSLARDLRGGTFRILDPFLVVVLALVAAACWAGVRALALA